MSGICDWLSFKNEVDLTFATVGADMRAAVEAARVRMRLERFDCLVNRLKELANEYNHAALEFLEEFDDPRRKVTWDDLHRIEDIVAAAGGLS